MIISSILKIVMAASVANLRLLTLDIPGSMTPWAKLFLILPLVKSSPEYFKLSFFSSLPLTFYEALWNTLNLAKSSVASLAAFKARTFGMI